MNANVYLKPKRESITPLPSETKQLPESTYTVIKIESWQDDHKRLHALQSRIKTLQRCHKSKHTPLVSYFLSYNQVREALLMLIYRPAFFELLFPLGISISSPRSPLLFSNIEFKKKHTHPDCIGLFYLCLSNSPPAEQKEGIFGRQHRREEQ